MKPRTSKLSVLIVGLVVMFWMATYQELFATKILAGANQSLNTSETQNDSVAHIVLLLLQEEQDEPSFALYLPLVQK